jgi:hypothetical protein
MALIGLGVVGLFVVALLSGLPNKTYRCTKCGYETNDEVMAAGHTASENQHKMV